MFNQHAKVILLNILLNSPFPRRPCQIMHPVYCRSPPSPLPQKKEILHNHCLRFFFGRMQYPGEMKNNYYAKFSFFGGGVGGGGVNEVLYGLCENGDSTHERETFR